jgi:Bifunctional DNA primase/polymerase, N-terminal
MARGRERVGFTVSRASEREAAAHRYADAGWHVFPAEPGGKRPATGHGFLDGTTDHRQIQNWWRSDPRFNLAIATGAPGPDVLDVDKHQDGSGFGAFNRLKREGLVREPMAIIRTPSGGFHAYFKGTEHQRNGHIPGVYVDFRSQGGYVVAPPSKIAGRTYEVAHKQPSADTFDWSAAKQLLAPEPERQPYKPPGRTADGPRDVSHLAPWMASRPEGSRNESLFWAANRAIEADDLPTRDSLAAAARSAGLDDREIDRTITSAQQTAGRGGGQRSFEHSGAAAPAALPLDLQAEAEAGALEPRPASRPAVASNRPAGHQIPSTWKESHAS